MTTRRFAYLHGFASSPLARKGLALEAALAPRGAKVELPDLNQPSFGRLTVTGALGALDALHARAPEATWGLVGSSFGGLVAARWAELHPERVDRLLLLCPAFGMLARWTSVFGDDVMERWERRGTLPMHDAEGRLTPLHWGFVEDLRTHPSHPAVAAPTRILHGRQDETVPVDSSRAYARGRAHVRQMEVDDDHRLTASIDRVTQEAWRFLVRAA